MYVLFISTRLDYNIHMFVTTDTFASAVAPPRCLLVKVFVKVSANVFAKVFVMEFASMFEQDIPNIYPKKGMNNYIYQ